MRVKISKFSPKKLFVSRNLFIIGSFFLIGAIAVYYLTSPQNLLNKKDQIRTTLGFPDKYDDEPILETQYIKVASASAWQKPAKPSRIEELKDWSQLTTDKANDLWQSWPHFKSNLDIQNLDKRYYDFFYNNGLLPVQTINGDFNEDGEEDWGFISIGVGCASCHDKSVHLFIGQKIFSTITIPGLLYPRQSRNGFYIISAVYGEYVPLCCPENLMSSAYAWDGKGFIEKAQKIIYITPILTEEIKPEVVIPISNIVSEIKPPTKPEPTVVSKQPQEIEQSAITHDGTRTGPIVDYFEFCAGKTISVYENERLPYTVGAKTVFITKGDIDCYENLLEVVKNDAGSVIKAEEAIISQRGLPTLAEEIATIQLKQPKEALNTLFIGEGTQYTDSLGITHFRSDNGVTGTAYTDSLGFIHYSDSTGRTATFHTDSLGFTRGGGFTAYTDSLGFTHFSGNGLSGTSYTDSLGFTRYRDNFGRSTTCHSNTLGFTTCY